MWQLSLFVTRWVRRSPLVTTRTDSAQVLPLDFTCPCQFHPVEQSRPPSTQFHLRFEAIRDSNANATGVPDWQPETNGDVILHGLHAGSLRN